MKSSKLQVCSDYECCNVGNKNSINLHFALLPAYMNNAINLLVWTSRT